MSTGKQGDVRSDDGRTWSIGEPREELLRYTRTEGWSVLARFPITAEGHVALLAGMLGSDGAAVRDELSDLQSMVRRVSEKVVLPPTGPDGELAWHGQRVAAVGDSLTADRLSWFELLSAAHAPDGQPAPSLTNLSLSGATTADALERFDLIEAARPSLVLVMLGTNDVRRHGRRHPQRMLSLPETRRNLTALCTLIGTDLSADVRLITPPPADQDLIDRFPARVPVSVRAEDIDEVAEVVRSLGQPFIDVHGPMKDAGAREFLEADGIHLNVAGQRTVAEHVLSALATDPPKAGPVAAGTAPER